MKILVINPSYADATSYYRAWGTFKDLQDRYNLEFVKYSHLTAMCNNKVSWPDLFTFDVVFFQRALGDNSLILLKYLKDLGVKIWYDLDDDLWNIPFYYDIKKTYTKEIMQTIEDHIKLSDLVTCSTEQLSNVIKEKTDKEAHVISNAWDIKRYPLQPHNAEGITLWRGSNTHADDLRQNSHILKEISEHTKINFMGFNPVANKPNLKLTNYSYIAPLDPLNYYRWIIKTRPKQMIVLLQDTPFNESKSNIAWLEATAAGALTYSNQVGEFSKVSIDIEWINNSELNNHNEQLEVNQFILKDLYSLTYWNDVRAKLLIELCK
jgi:hypothetical protein